MKPEQQLKLQWTQSRSSSRSGRNRGAAAEVHTIGELQVKLEQQLNLQWPQSRSNSQSGEQLKRMQSGTGVAAEADTSGEQQLKRTQTGNSS